MASRDMILTLAKLVIAAAWADGEVSREEINSMKDLLFHLPRRGYKQAPRLTGREWAMLEMYMETPVGPEERERLIQQLQAELGTPRDRELAIETLEGLVEADGDVTQEERAVLDEIKSALNQVDLSILGRLGRLIQGPLERRSAAARGPNRERQLEDFIRNRIYYAVQERLKATGQELNIPDADLRKLSLAGGLMARVAHVDHDVTRGELDTMIKALQSGWDVSDEAATFVAEVAVSKASADLDYYRLTREFATSTTREERARFLDVLFAVAQASGGISYNENEEIRRISKSLNLGHQSFVAARDRVREEGQP
jgi:uncharacterized tellurite resistance protein B-like protein